MQYCAALCKSYPHLGTPTQAALFYGEICQDFFDSLKGDDRLLLDYLTLVEFNLRQIEALKEDEKKREDEKNFPGIAARLPIDEIKARLDERNRQTRGEF